MERQVFWNCTGLTSATFADGVGQTGSNAFKGCTNLATVYLGAKVIDEGALKDCTALTSVTISDSVNQIGASAFQNCTGLTSVVIPQSVTSCGTDAFSGCTSLKRGIYPSALSNPFPATTVGIAYAPDDIMENDWIFSADRKKIKLAPLSYAGAYAVPSTFNAIGAGAFSHCAGLTSIEIPSTVLFIGDNSFNGCTGLTSVKIPASLSKIGTGAFAQCTGLTSVSLPYTLTSISDNAFSGCTGLTEVVVPPMVKTIGASAFQDASALEAVYMGPNVQTIGAKAFNGAPLQSFYITVQEQPAVADDAFSESVGTLYLQGEGTSANYSAAAWNNFGSRAVMTSPTSLKIKNQIGGGAGIKVRCDAAFEPADVSLPYLFWYSSNPSVASVDENGLVTLLATPTADNSCKIYAQSLYAGSAGVAEISLTNTVTEFNYTYQGVELTYTVTDQTAKTCRVKVPTSADITSVVIPETAEAGALKFTVTAINASAFIDCANLATVSLPGTLTAIGAYAFHRCTSLKSIVVPDKVNNIGPAAFMSCSSLTSITLPSGLTQISESLLRDCPKLGSVVIPANVTTIVRMAFNSCKSLKTIVIPDKVTSIADGAFQACSALTSVTLPESLTTLGISVFHDCSKLESVVVPESVTEIGRAAFYNCKSLKSAILPSTLKAIPKTIFSGCNVLETVNIPSTVTSFGDYAFYNCHKLQTANIPEGVTELGTAVWYGCKSLKEITIPSTLAVMPGQMFQGCTGLEKVTVADGAAQLGVDAFKDCTQLTTVYVGAETIDDSAFSGCTALTSLTLSNSVKQIGAQAFLNCSGLKSVILPRSLTSYSADSFKGCTGLKKVAYPSTLEKPSFGTVNVPYYASDVMEDGWIYSNGRKIIRFVPIDYAGAYSIADGVTTVDYGAFAFCGGLTSIEIPASVTSLKNTSFYDCTGLTEVDIPNSVTYLGNYLFRECTNLTSVNIPASVATLGEGAFYYCSALTSVKIPEAVTKIDKYMFVGCTNLTSVDLPPTLTLIDSRAFSRCGKLASVELPVGLTTIAGQAFENCTSLTEVVLPPAVTAIGNDAFNGATSLAKVYMGAHIVSIGATAFAGAPLQDVYITTQTPPAIDEGVFSTYAGTLHVQGAAAQTRYRADSVWGRFAATGTVTVPLSMTTDPSGADFVKKGDTFTITTTFNPATIDLPFLFYDSSDRSVVSVDGQGNVTVVGEPDGSDCTLTVETLYADFPAAEISLDSKIEDFTYTYEGVDMRFTVIDQAAGTCKLSRLLSTAITDLVIPSVAKIDGKEFTVTEIGEGAVQASNVVAVKVPDTVTEIGEGAFMNCRKLESIELPESLTTIGESAFNFCVVLTEIELPRSLTTINAAAFANCSALTQIVIPGKVTEIQENTFARCSALTSVLLPNSVTSIGKGAFIRCTSLEDIVFPPSVETIGVEAVGYTNIRNVYMGPNVKTIGANAFLVLGGPDRVYITAQTPPSMPTTAFDDIKSVFVLVQGEEAKARYEADPVWSKVDKIVSFEAPESVTTTASSSIFVTPGTKVALTTTFEPEDADLPYAFYTSADPELVYVDCEGFATVLGELGSTGCKITTQTLYANEPTREISLLGEVEDFNYEYENGGELIYTIIDPDAGTCRVKAPVNKNLIDCVIPEYAKLGGMEFKVVEIGEKAFYNCSRLESVEIPTTVTKFSPYAFSGCTALEAIEIPESVTVIGAGAFQACAHLKEIVLPDGIEEIAEQTFLMCSNLESITIPNTVTSIGYGAFRGAVIKSINIPNSVVYIAPHALGISGVQSVTLSNSITSIEYYTFYHCEDLTTVVIPPHVEIIGERAFADCTNLKSVYMGPDVREIGAEAFPSPDDVYVTAQTPPAISANTFSAYTGTLHVQSEAAKALYEADPVWGGFANIMVIEEPTGISIRKGVSETGPIYAESQYNTATHIYASPGDSMQRVVTLEREDESADDSNFSPHTFWSSSDPSKVYVENDGSINVKEYPEVGKPVTLTAESLYANGPTRTVVVDNYTMTGVDEIFEDDGDEELDPDAPARIFTISGLPAGTSLDRLQPGIYIVVQGKKKVKINIR